MLAVWGSYTCRFKYSLHCKLFVCLYKKKRVLKRDLFKETPILQVLIPISTLSHDHRFSLGPGVVLKVKCNFCTWIFWIQPPDFQGAFLVWKWHHVHSTVAHVNENLQTNITCSWKSFLWHKQWKSSGAVHRFNTANHNLKRLQILIVLKTSSFGFVFLLSPRWMIVCLYENLLNYWRKCTVRTPKTRPLLAVPEMFTFRTLDFHMTGTVSECVN